MSRDPNRTALVTGASAGIGAAIAEELALAGFDLVLVARRRDRLEALAQDLQRRHGVHVRTCPVDLASPAAASQLWDTLAADGVTIDVLVNNAGFAVPQTYLDSSWSQQDRFLQVMLTTAAHLTYLALPGMVRRGYGRLMFVSSSAAFTPGSVGNTTYCAAKAFLVRFAESLSLELEGSGVHATAVCPGFTHTEFHSTAGVGDLVKQVPDALWMDAREVARLAVGATMAGTPVYVTGRLNRLLVLLFKLLPASASRRIVRHESRKLAVKKVPAT